MKNKNADSKQYRRLGCGFCHPPILTTIALLTLVWAILMPILQKFVLVHLPDRLHFAIYWSTCPPVWFGLMVGLILVGSITWLFVLFLLELPASGIGLSVWQYSKERRFGVPRWIADRMLLLLASAGMTALTLLAFGISSGEAIAAFFGRTGLSVAGIACVWAVLITWALAFTIGKGQDKEMRARVWC